MSQQAAELNADGKQFEEMVDIIADDWGLPRHVAYAVVEGWWEGKVMRNFDWSEENTVGC